MVLYLSAGTEIGPKVSCSSLNELDMVWSDAERSIKLANGGTAPDRPPSRRAAAIIITISDLSAGQSQTRDRHRDAVPIPDRRIVEGKKGEEEARTVSDGSNALGGDEGRKGKWETFNLGKERGKLTKNIFLHRSVK